MELYYGERAKLRQLKRYQCSSQQIWYIDKDVDVDGSSSTAAATVLILHAFASPHFWQLATRERGTPATYGNSIRARQSGNSSKQHGVSLVRAQSSQR